MAPELIGYQAVIDWMGTPYVTLRDVWPDAPRAAIVGLNPPPGSVAKGHYYQGPVGQRQMHRLVAGGLLPTPPDGRTFEGVGASVGIGFTDIVKRPTVGEKDLTRAELEYGMSILGAKLAERDVPVVICVYRQPVRALLGDEGVPGWQEARTAWGARVFRMPGPYTGTALAASIVKGLGERVREL
ncbi:hypothetical protein LGT39_08475 [Demequina sp. TTPB684]|uniref:uracil-DNA glycosylase family protein n=1 Tax=unclassified Demequina TaxID=2620311 RepID=UPI001CF31787|nr:MULTISPECIES: uracil-DNA glycosylase family protein [unclassified Demequina]MCB2412879.1 hypothetical protein [Demequina sp. TTPB684]UPU88142.1 hypothetical protein LGT36_012980 [Demequina sp. TMPB413]